MDKYIAVLGLGVVGSPLAHLLYKKYGEDFALLTSKEYLHSLTDNDLYINGELFSPNIFYKKEQLQKKIGVLFICVKNYHVDGIVDFVKEMVDEETIIFPLQNGVCSFERFSTELSNNTVLEGFAQGPNTQILGGSSFVYQKAGMFHVGSSDIDKRPKANYVYDLLISAGVEAYYDDNIQYQVWKKLMLNVAGNAITALTDIDYCMFKKSAETQDLCRKAMREFITVAQQKGISLTEKDIDDVMEYYLSFKVSKKTSMLEDVTNKRMTENMYIAGYISQLAKKLDIPTPHIDTLFMLIKIKEDVYLGRL